MRARCSQPDAFVASFLDLLHVSPLPLPVPPHVNDFGRVLCSEVCAVHPRARACPGRALVLPFAVLTDLTFLAFFDPLPPLCGELAVSRAAFLRLLGVAHLDTLHPPITVVDDPLRTRAVRMRVQLEFFEILGLVLAQTTIQIFKCDERMVPSGEIDVTFFFLQFRCTHGAAVSLSTGHSFILVSSPSTALILCFLLLCVIKVAVILTSLLLHASSPSVSAQTKSPASSIKLPSCSPVCSSVCSSASLGNRYAGHSSSSFLAQETPETLLFPSTLA